MAITAESLLPGATDPWDSRNPVLDRALRLDQDPVLSELAERHTVLVSKLIALRGLQEVPKDEKTILVAAELTVDEVFSRMPDDDRAETVKRWLDPGSYPPYADDFSYIEVKWVENRLESPFLGLAYENLPLRDERDRLNLGNDNIAITALRRQLDIHRTTAYKPADESKEQKTGYVSRRNVHGIVHNVVPKEQYL